MKNHSNSSYIKTVITLLFLLLLAKSIGVVTLWFLPAHGISTQNEASVTMPYVRVDFHNMLDSTTKTQQVSQHNSHAKTLDINNLVLKALYGKGNYGFVIIAAKSNPKKTTLLSVGESYEGYKLKGVFLNYALFTKRGQEYRLRLNSTLATKSLVHAVEDESANKIIQRDEIEGYVKNPSAVWKDISIQEVGKNGNFKGFKVTKIRAGSALAKLGLQTGDLIVKANNIVLKSYNDVLKIYQQLDKLTTLTLVIKRGNIEKEIVYEIN